MHAFRFPVFFALVVLFSCTKAVQEKPEDGVDKAISLEKKIERLKSERAKWNAFTINNYSFDQQLSCFCVWHMTEKYSVTVSNKTIVAVDDAPVDPELHNHLKTIDATFDYVLQLLAEKPYKINITYHSTFGFITSFDVDRDKRIADEEHGYTFTNFNVAD